MNSKKTFYLILALFYTILGLVVSFQTNTIRFWGTGTALGILAALFFLQLPSGRAITTQIRKTRSPKRRKTIQKILRDLECHVQEIRSHPTSITIPFIKKNKKLPLPSLLTSSYFVIGFMLLLLDRENKFFSGFMGFATTTIWFNAWLYWQS